MQGWGEVLEYYHFKYIQNKQTKHFFNKLLVQIKSKNVSCKYIVPTLFNWFNVGTSTLRGLIVKKMHAFSFILPLDY